MCHKSPRGLLPGRLVEISIELVVIAWGRCGSQLRGFLPLSSRLLVVVQEVCPRFLGVSKIPRRVCAKTGTASDLACDGEGLLGLPRQAGEVDAFQASHKGSEMAAVSGSPVVAIR